MSKSHSRWSESQRLTMWQWPLMPTWKAEAHVMIKIDQHVDFLSSKDIQDAIKEMVFASISTITEYMVEHGYKMMQIEGGRLVWIIKDTMSE